ncbi:MAG: ABC transporter permease [Oscillospiraceae bacterium]|nr:ABC transporter permease [Oscillospiraceae bacterium]
MRSVTKNIFREIKRTKNRFFSIFTICAIGVGFFSGVRATGSDMKMTADNYYDDHRLFDLRVMSTSGLTDGDLHALEQTEGISAVQGSKYSDLVFINDSKDYNTRVYSWNPDDKLNRIDLLEGRFPQADNECILNVRKMNGQLSVGDRLTLISPSEDDEFPLENSEFTVVGLFDTPMYISSTQRGSTTIGDGSLDAFLYIPESNFTQEVYTEIYVQSDGLKELASYSDEYDALRDSISDRLETLGIDRSEIRYEEVIGEAEQKIADGEKDLEKGKTEGQQKLDDAKAELDNAAKQISDGEKELSEAADKIADGEKQIAEAKQTLADAKTEIDEGKAELAENEQKLNDAKQQLDESRQQLDGARNQLDEAKKALDDSKKQLDDGQAEIVGRRSELEAGKAQLEAGKQQLESGRAEYESGKAQYDENLAKYEDGLEQYRQAAAQLDQAAAMLGEDDPTIKMQRGLLENTKTQLDEAKIQLDAAKAQLDEAESQLTQSEQTIAATEQQIADGEAQLNAAQEQIDSGIQQYNDGLAQYNENYAKFQDGVEQYNAGYREYSDGLIQFNNGKNKLADAERQYNDGVAELAEKEQEFLDGKADYVSGVKELEDAKQKYRDGLKEYQDGVDEFNTEIADAEKKIEDGRKQIADAGEAKWYVFTRDDNPGYSEYASNAERIDRIAAIFPVFFLLVAALVCLTTMSRMVEEQRMQIGTLKSLGYSNSVIMRQYMVYAVLAAASGSVLGAFIGMFFFPFVIMFAYGMMYIITNFYYELNPFNIVISAGSMVAAIALTVFFSARNALAGTPAELMRPRAPKAGKRVLLERIGFIWNKLSFFGKVSGRNLFRYKRRMFMTVIGIAGCTALSLTGFGLKDSISDIVNLQYNSINNYSGFIAYESQDDVQGIYDALLDYSPDTEYTRALIKQYTVSSDSGTVQCYVTAVEDTDKFEDMIDFRDRKSGEKLGFDSGIIVTEKMTKLLGVKSGDTVTLRISDGNTREVTIGAVTEHYTSHYMYIPEEKYAELFGEVPDYNIVYFRNGMSAEQSVQDDFTTRMLAVNGVLTVTVNSGASSQFADMMKIMDLVVVVLILSAGALAFVVLYNLTNVNITERIREIATLKVLGFYDKEVSSYVFRENNILSVMGGILGLGIGVALCQFIIQTAEIDEVMFGRNIHPLSFLWAFLITVAFSLIVNLIMRKELIKISMVESLKSVE